MGGNFSYLPSVQAANSFCCVTFRSPDKITVIDCDNGELEVIRRAINRTYKLGVRSENEKYGAWSFVLAGYPFRPGSPKEEAIAGKLTACAILHDMFQRGWKASISSELCRSKDRSSWFFQEMQQPQFDCHVCCLSLSGTDRLQLIHFPKKLMPAVVAAVNQVWSLGIQEELKETFAGFELKLHGNPWSASEREGVEARRLILEIVRRLSAEGFDLYISSSFKDTTDSLFFCSGRTDKNNFVDDASFIMSLNNEDRVWLIDAPPQLCDVVRNLLNDKWTDSKNKQGVTKDHQLHGARELKLWGTPWWSTGMDSVKSRLLITLLLQEMRLYGWRLLETIQVCRRLSDKAAFLFVKAEPQQQLHWCLSLNESSLLRFVNAPMEVVDALRLIIAGKYVHGIKKEKIYSGYHQVRLRGRPWTAHPGNDRVHGRHLMLGVLEAMQQRGWAIVCSADVAATYHHADSGQDYPLDVHSWWFAAQPMPDARFSVVDLPAAAAANKGIKENGNAIDE